MSCVTETCPSCGVSPEGRDFTGAPRDTGGSEHVCRACQSMYIRTMRRAIERISRKSAFSVSDLSSFVFGFAAR
jgi:hypothetical protein